MSEDSEDDNFNYGSKQDYGIIEYQIALFESRQKIKIKKTKQE
jgi:hypothetical protein